MLLESSDDELNLYARSHYANLGSSIRSSSRSADGAPLALSTASAGTREGGGLSYFHHVTPSRSSVRSAMSAISSTSNKHNSHYSSSSYATLRRSLPSSSVSPGYLPPILLQSSSAASPARQGTMLPSRSRNNRQQHSQQSSHYQIYSSANQSTGQSSSNYIYHNNQTPVRTQASNSSSSTCSSDSTASQILISSGSTPSPPRGYLNLPPPPPPSKPPPLPPPNLPPRPVNGFTKSCQSIPLSVGNQQPTSDIYQHRGSVGITSKSQISLLVSPTHQIEPVYSNKLYMSTHSLGASLGGVGGRVGYNNSNAPLLSSAVSIPSMSQPLAPRDESGEDDDEIDLENTGDKIYTGDHRIRHSGYQHKGQHNHHSRVGRHSQRHRSRSRDSTEISCFLKYMLFGCNMIAWLIGFLIIAAGVWAWNEKDYLSNLLNIPLLILDPAFGLIVLGGISFIIGFVGCVGSLRENTCLLATYSIFLITLLVLELGLSILAFVMKDWIRSQATQGMQAFIVYYRDDPDRQNLIDWIQESWLECCGIEGPKDWDMNIYFNCSSVAQGSKEACGVPFSCCRSDSGNIYDDRIILKNKQCGYDVRKPDFMLDRSSIISEKGCLRAAEEWIEGNFMLISILTLAIAAIQILGICFAQNLRADIIAQRSKWR